MKVKPQDIRVGATYRSRVDGRWILGELRSEHSPYFMIEIGTGRRFVVDNLHYAAVIDGTEKGLLENGGGI